ncbi:MAG TPA: ATP-binding cassette domain-containing protein [Candidatus Acidoferrales bacterium]|nr:ATP-binding cassette domain-containing protein [Candidatus Acidoferrales bacterium]
MAFTASEAAPRAPEISASVQTIELTRSFEDLVAVDHLSFSTASGSIFGLLGPNGAGKSTLIKMLTTLLRPSGGTALVAGFDVVRQPREVRRRIGYVSQMLSADGDLTGYENLLISAKLYGISRAERTMRIAQALEFMELTEAAGKIVRHYSGGMIRRLEIAQSMLHRPAVLFLDEPTVGLDPMAKQAVWQRIQALRGEFDTTIFMTTHDMEEADELCDVVAFMHSGRLFAQGSPAELKTRLGPEASLGDVFIHYAGSSIAEEGDWTNVARTRSTARRLE